MKIKILIAAMSVLSVVKADVINEEPQAYGRFVPERKDDFAWENDKVAFRVYGPASSNGNWANGIDCWLKRVSYPIIDRWYRKNGVPGKSYHKDDGEGADNYQVGPSLGCGGTALWIDDTIYSTGAFTDWDIIFRSTKRFVFQVVYRWKVKAIHYSEVKRFTIELGDQLFRVDSTFFADGKPAAYFLDSHSGLV